MKRRIIFAFLFALILYTFILPTQSFSRDPNPEGGGASVRVWEAGFVMDLHENDGVGQTTIFYEVAWLPNGGYGESDWEYKSDTYSTGSSGYWFCEVYVPADQLTGNGELIWKMYKIQSLPGNVYHGVGPDGWSSAVSRYYDYDYPNDIPSSEFWVYDYRNYDEDRNEILDDNEMPLAEKFCPTYILNSPTEYIRPEPVQYMGIEKTDLWFDLYSSETGQFVDTYQITSQSTFDPPISYWNAWVTGPDNFANIRYDPPYNYTGTPPNHSNRPYLLRFHWNYAGNCDSEDCWSDYYATERVQNNYPNTQYVHMFVYNTYVIIQYWSFYPYNDFVNNHEGDWEHITVWVDSQDPSTASIVKVEYYFHHKYLVRNPGSFEVDNVTHPIVYVGGESSLAPGVHSGGNFPESKLWKDAGAVCIDEDVNGNGPVISWSSFIDENPNDEYGLVILPDLGDIDYTSYPNMSWFKATIPWGYIDPDSWADWVGPIIHHDIGNFPPPSLAYRPGWNAVGSDGGKYKLYKKCLKKPPAEI